MADNSPPPTKVTFDYIKSNLFRTARCDGAWAGVNGSGDVVLSLYSERSPIPKRSVNKLNGILLGEEIIEERVTRDAIVREIEISMSMNLRSAKALRDLIDEHIKSIEKMRAAADQTSEENR